MRQIEHHNTQTTEHTESAAALDARDGRFPSGVQHFFREVVMKVQQRYQGQTLRGAQQFLDVHADVVGTVNSSDARGQLDAAVAQLDATVDEQGAKTRETRGETSSLRALERNLKRGHMTPISKYARSKLSGSPQFQALTPNTGGLVGNGLVESARAMAVAAASHEHDLVAAQFPADFLAQLRAAAQAVKQTVLARADKRRQRSGATTAVATAIRDGRLAIKALDALVTRFILNDERLTEEWRVATRVATKPGVLRSGTPVAQVNAQPASAPVEVSTVA